MFTGKAFFIAALCIVAATATNFDPCEKLNPPTKLTVDGCETQPCNFHRGKNVTASWSFYATHDADMLVPVVKVVVGQFDFPYNYPEKNACNSLDQTSCPLEAGEKAVYKLNMPVPGDSPHVSLNLKFYLEDENKNVHVCLKLRAQVVD